MAAQLELIEVCRDDKNKAVVNLHAHQLQQDEILLIVKGVAYKTSFTNEWVRLVITECLHQSIYLSFDKLIRATLQSWIHDGTEMVFVSKNAVFDNKKAIRGGIPVVFPCFGPWDLGPQHGFARISKWQLSSRPTKDGNGDVSAVFCLRDSEDTRKIWNGNKFEVQYTVTVKSDGLVTELAVKNLNESASFEFTCLLHTYFGLPDVTKTTISGLGGLGYVDKTDGGLVKQEHSEPKTISQFTDSVYMNAVKDHVITNVAGGKSICLTKTNFPDTVIWNPWAEKAKAMSDFGDDEYSNMVCVEAGYVSKPFTLPGGESFVASQSLKII